MLKKHLADILIIGGLLVTSGATFAGFKIHENLAKRDNLVAKVYQNRECVKVIDLHKASNEVATFTLDGLEGHMLFGYKKDAICVLESDCPKRVCIERGWVSGGLPLICAHYGVSIYVEAASNDLDAIIK